MIQTKFKGLTLCSLVVLLAAGQAFAHTGVRDKVVTEGTSSYNGFTITHGCGEHTGDQTYPVLGQAALFPFGANAVWRNAAGNVIKQKGPLTNPDTGGPINNGNGIISDDALSLAVNGYASFSSPFTTTQEIVDELGSVQALFWKNGAMEPKLNAITPFKITAPTIVDNCTRLKIRVGVINYCDVDKNAANDGSGPYKAPKDYFGRPIPFVSDINNVAGVPQTNVADSSYYKDIKDGNGDNNRADWWFYNLYGGSALYSDKDMTAEGAGLWSAVITVDNSADQLAKCSKVKEVTVEPSGAAFDAYLTGRNTRPFTKGNTNL